MELTGVGPSGELGHAIEGSEEFANHLAGIFALAELLDLSHEPGQRIFGLSDGHLRVVLALALQTGVVFVQFLPEEVSQTLAGRIPEWHLGTWRNTVR
jgi:hypothetical protein